MVVKKLPISFKRDEQYIRDYITSHLNYSAYVKELILKDMRSNSDCIKVNKKESREIIENGGFDF